MTTYKYRIAESETIKIDANSQLELVVQLILKGEATPKDTISIKESGFFKKEEHFNLKEPKWHRFYNLIKLSGLLDGEIELQKHYLDLVAAVGGSDKLSAELGAIIKRDLGRTATKPEPCLVYELVCQHNIENWERADEKMTIKYYFNEDSFLKNCQRPGVNAPDLLMGRNFEIISTTIGSLAGRIAIKGLAINMGIYTASIFLPELLSSYEVVLYTEEEKDILSDSHRFFDYIKEKILAHADCLSLDDESPFEGPSKSSILTCGNCGFEYAILSDSIIMTTQRAKQNIQSEGVAVLSISNNAENEEDMVDDLFGVPDDNRTNMIEECKQDLPTIQDSIRSNSTSRKWVCRKCRCSQDYPGDFMIS